MDRILHRFDCMVETIVGNQHPVLLKVTEFCPSTPRTPSPFLVLQALCFCFWLFGWTCIIYCELTVKHAHHDKGPLLGDPILNSAFGITVTFAHHNHPRVGTHALLPQTPLLCGALDSFPAGRPITTPFLNPPLSPHHGRLTGASQALELLGASGSRSAVSFGAAIAACEKASAWQEAMAAGGSFGGQPWSLAGGKGGVVIEMAMNLGP